MLTEIQCKTILSFVLDRVSQEELTTALGFDFARQPERVLPLVEAAADSGDGDQVYYAMLMAHQVTMNPDYVPTLVRLIGLPWHKVHEDLARALQQLRDPRAVDALFAAASAKHAYLEHDEFGGLARKCTWALADIGTPEAQERLRAIAAWDDPMVAGFAKKRIDAWDEERARKGHRGA